MIPKPKFVNCFHYLVLKSYDWTTDLDVAHAAVQSDPIAIMDVHSSIRNHPLLLQAAATTKVPDPNSAASDGAVGVLSDAQAACEVSPSSVTDPLASPQPKGTACPQTLFPPRSPTSHTSEDEMAGAAESCSAGAGMAGGAADVDAARDAEVAVERPALMDTEVGVFQQAPQQKAAVRVRVDNNRPCAHHICR